MPSPNDDWGYDVADYCAVHPDLGTLEDLDELIAEAGRRGIRILLDLVPNHTSDRHAWFQDALGGRDAKHREFYVWADPKPDGSPPNNWLSSFGGPAWTLDEAVRPVLPAQLPAHAARPQLVERGGPRRVRRDPALLVRPRRRRLAHRRDARHRQGPRAARRPRGDRGRPPADPGAREQAGVLDEPARGPRRPAALARDRRRGRPEAHPRGGDLRARPRAADAVLRRGRGRAQPRLQLPVRARAARGRAAAGDRRGGRAASCRRSRGRSGSAPTTTPAGSPRAGRRAIRRAPGSR